MRIQGERLGIGGFRLLKAPEIAQHVAQVMGQGKVLKPRLFQGP